MSLSFACWGYDRTEALRSGASSLDAMSAAGDQVGAFLSEPFALVLWILVAHTMACLTQPIGSGVEGDWLTDAFARGLIFSGLLSIPMAVAAGMVLAVSDLPTWTCVGIGLSGMIAIFLASILAGSTVPALYALDALERWIWPERADAV